MRGTRCWFGVVLLLVVAAGAAGRRGPSEPPLARWVVVQPGDTLWALAGRCAAPRLDRRAVLQVVLEVNQLTGATIYPGQRLLLPQGRAAVRAAQRAPERFVATAQAVRG
ncbi:MAG: LysM peptidoglycan-binding domain-containing protein [Fimbriimonadaceae bacterium]|nr:LysM peptidoglycan-binding domain-containing protein [Fimbriimonadaceae bacterium]